MHECYICGKYKECNGIPPICTNCLYVYLNKKVYEPPVESKEEIITDEITIPIVDSDQYPLFELD